MGLINIEFKGSFPSHLKHEPQEFCAEMGGHADAVSQAIEYLAAKALPAAIVLDHDLAASGENPMRAFGKGRDPHG